MMSMQSITTWKFDSLEPLSLARRFAHLEGTAVLYSGGTFDSAKTTFLCLFPEKKIALFASQACWDKLQSEIGSIENEDLSIPRWVGYIGYEMGCYADCDQIIPHFQSQMPDCLFYKPTVVVGFDHVLGLATLYSTSAAASLNREDVREDLKTKIHPDIHLVEASDTLETYLEKIAFIQGSILDGEIYQVNLSQQFLFEGTVDPFALFEKSVKLNPAPFAAFIQCGEYALVSSSPERFLCKQRDRLETRPIKGTAPRGITPFEDALNKETLLHSEKERAELLMITDLMRSDMGKISLPGSVKTHALWRCEAYANVFHLLSVIEGRALPQRHSVELIRSLFPGGSVTGCPKLRAMEMITQLEKRPRGIYTGSIGYFAKNGDFDFNIAIRTLIVHPKLIQLQLGGAIVIDSDPMREFEETLHKGRSLFNLLGQGGL